MDAKNDKENDPTMAKDYFTGHRCQVPPEKLSKYKIKCGRFRRFWLDISSVHLNDIRALRLYRSYAALREEKYRQYQNFPLSIHPYSKLRHWLETTFVIALTLSNVLVATHYTEKDLEKHEGHEILIYSIDLLYLFNVLANFFTGYIEGNTSKNVVMDLRKISCRYARTWLAIDIISSAGCLCEIDEQKFVTLQLVLVAMKILRLPVLIKYLDNVLTVRQTAMKRKTILELSLLILSYLSWNIYFQFATEYVAEGRYTPVNPRNCSWITIGKLWHQSSPTRLAYTLDRAAGMLRKNANMNLIHQAGCFETFFIISWLVAKLLVYHCALKYTVSAFGSESAQAKYYIMMKQVETYMDQRNFPPRIKQKVLKFYAIRFQSNFFMESSMLSSVSGQLREDIVMHTGRQLVREMEFLKQLPKPLLLQIALKLRLVIFTAGDIIYKINSIGDCLYCIDKGTVAIYTESGSEIGHLEDGDYFGAIALVTNNRFRPASVVAVTNCELFRLDREDFDSTFAIYPTIYEKIKKEANKRYERLVLHDEHHKAELKMADEHRQNNTL